jgi:hypothetical protein
MEINIRVKYKMETNMEKEFIFILAVIGMMENGKMICKMEMEK